MGTIAMTLTLIDNPFIKTPFEKKASGDHLNFPPDCLLATDDHVTWNASPILLLRVGRVTRTLPSSRFPCAFSLLVLVFSRLDLFFLHDGLPFVFSKDEYPKTLVFSLI